MEHILIVDAEEDLLWALSKNLFKDRKDIKIRTASTGEEALKLIKKHKTNLLVTDTRVAGDIDGFNLILRAKDAIPKAKLIAMTAFSTEGTDFMPSLGVAHFINKPFDITELRELILVVLEEKEGYRGIMDDLALADIIALLCLCERTVLLHLNHRGRRGRFEVVDGTIKHAEFMEMTGPEAAWTMLGLEQGDIFMQSDFQRSPESVTISWQELLGQAAAWLEEHGVPEEVGDEVDIPVEGWDDDELSLDAEPDAEGASSEMEENPLGFSDEELREMVMDEEELPSFNPEAPSAQPIQKEDTLPRAPMLRPPSQTGNQPASSLGPRPPTATGLRPVPGSSPTPAPAVRSVGRAEASLDELLQTLTREVPSFIAADIVHIEDGSSIAGVAGPDSGGFDQEAAAAFYGALVRTAVRAASAFGDAAMATVQITTDAHHILARAIPGAPYAQLVTCGRDGNLGIARVVMRRLDGDMSVAVPH